MDTTNNQDKDKGKESTSKTRGSFRGGRFGGGRGHGVFTGKCFHCNEVGHQSFKCPKMNDSDQGRERRVHMVQQEEQKIVQSRPADPETGESLMVRRGQPLQQQKESRPSIFRTNCLSHGKVCKMVIDSGSFDNLVSYEMVLKLGLKRYPIDRPYRASWVSDEQNIVVREQAMVDFSIGEYKDQVLCDIIPMT